MAPASPQITAAAGRNVATGPTDAPTAAQVLARFGDPNFALGPRGQHPSDGGRVLPGGVRVLRPRSFEDG